MNKKSFIKKNIKIFILVVFSCFIIFYLFAVSLNKQISGYKKINNSSTKVLKKQIEEFDNVKKVDIYFTRPSIRIYIYPDKADISDNDRDLIFDLVKETINYQLVYDINESDIHWDGMPDVNLRIKYNDGAHQDRFGSFYTSYKMEEITETIIWNNWVIFQR